MKIGIHYKGNFADQWIEYCKKNNIDYKVLSAYDTDVIKNLQDCQCFLWHHSHVHYKDTIAAKKILFALEHAGIDVFPNFWTGWHFDDKVAQKYLLEAIGTLMVPSYVFYDKEEALKWVNRTSFPKVFKLKGGAGSSNVKLVRTKSNARKLIGKAFGRGFSQFDRIENLKKRYQKYRSGQDTFIGLMKGFGRLLIPTEFSRQQLRERGYVYFQDFIPDNDHDTRVIVIGNKAVAERRIVRHNDFRASGSGVFSFDHINIKAVKIALDVSKKADFQAMAFDFVENDDGQPLIVEMSYGFGTKGISQAPGYWDKDLNWHSGEFKPEEWIIENLIQRIKSDSK